MLWHAHDDGVCQTRVYTPLIAGVHQLPDRAHHLDTEVRVERNAPIGAIERGADGARGQSNLLRRALKDQ